MRILAKHNKGGNYYINIEPTGTFKDIKEELEKQGSFSNSSFRFVFKGKVCSLTDSLSILSENAIVIFLVTPLNPPTNQPPQAPPPNQPPHGLNSSSQSNQSSSTKPSPAKPSQSVSSPQNPTSPPSSIPAQSQPSRSPQSSQSNANQLQEHITRFNQNLHPEQVFLPQNNIWTHPNEIENIRQLSLNGHFVPLVLSHSFRNLFQFSLFNSHSDENQMLGLIGIESLGKIIPVADIDATIQCFNNEQHESFQRLIALGYDRLTVFQTFVACNYNYDQTAECLSQMQ